MSESLKSKNNEYVKTGLLKSGNEYSMVYMLL